MRFSKNISEYEVKISEAQSNNQKLHEKINDYHERDK